MTSLCSELKKNEDIDGIPELILKDINSDSENDGNNETDEERVGVL